MIKMNVKRHKESMLLLFKVADNSLIVKVGKMDVKGFLDMIHNNDCPGCEDGEGTDGELCEDCKKQLEKQE